MSDIHISQLIRSKRRSIVISLGKRGEVIVKAPLRVPLHDIQAFVEEKSEWILHHREKIQSIQPKIQHFVEGEEFLYLGNPYTLKFVNTIEIACKNNVLEFPKVLVFRAKKELENWYIRQAKELITRRVSYHARQMNTSYKGIMFSDTKSKWGTCGPDNSLQFNWRLIMAPLLVIDYVVIHELVHTIEKNHARSFWSKVNRYTPAYKQHIKWLKTNQYKMIE